MSASLHAPHSPLMKARLTGALWLVTIAGGLFAELFVRSALIVRGDGAGTAAHIAASEPLYRLGFAADLIGAAAYLALSLLLYDLMRPAGRSLSLLAAGFGAAGSAVLAANLVNAYAPLVLLGLGYPAGNVGLQGSAALVMAFVRLHSAGYNVSLVFFAVQVGT